MLMLNPGRCWVPMALLVSAACADDTTKPSSDVEPDVDAAQDDDVGPRDDDSERGPDSDTCQRGGEFDACLDAATDKPVPDAGKPEPDCLRPGSEFGGECQQDAGARRDAGSPQSDAGPMENNPCLPGKARVCDGLVFGKVKTAGARCELVLGTWLRVRFSTCENCGTASFLEQGDLELRGCGSCDTVYAAAWSDNVQLAPHACASVDRTTSLTQTAVDPSCFDVYGTSYGFTPGQNPVYQEGSRDEARLCRCMAGTCKSCEKGACDGD